MPETREDRVAKIKICGIKTENDLVQLLELRPAMIGHIYYPQSARHCSERFIESTKRYDYQSSAKVLVIVDQEQAQIEHLLKLGTFTHLQLHNKYSPRTVAGIRGKLPEIQVIQVQRYPCSRTQLGRFSFADAQAEEIPDFLLFDYAGDLPGGNGSSYDWQNLARDLGEAEVKLPYILSGGINPENINAASSYLRRQQHCKYLDLNSGFELAPGQKDFSLLKKIL